MFTQHHGRRFTTKSTTTSQQPLAQQRYIYFFLMVILYLLLPSVCVCDALVLECLFCDLISTFISTGAAYCVVRALAKSLVPVVCQSDCVV